MDKRIQEIRSLLERKVRPYAIKESNQGKGINFWVGEEVDAFLKVNSKDQLVFGFYTVLFARDFRKSLNKNQRKLLKVIEGLDFNIIID